MKRILKYTVEPGFGLVPVAVHEGATLIKIANQNETLTLWFEDDTYRPQEFFDLVLMHTGNGFEDDRKLRYIDTVMFDGGDTVVHAYALL